MTDVYQASQAAVASLVAHAGIGGRRIRAVLGLLAEGPRTLASLIESSGVDRRTVQTVLAALGSDVVDSGAGLRIAPDRVAAYRPLALPVGSPEWPYGRLLAGREDLIDRLAERIAAAPAARRGLDHVSATAGTAALRALWLDATYDLSGARVLCVGDHDLTSVALARVNPAVEIAVVDVDDDILRYIEDTAPSVRCRWADLRFGLPSALLGWADLVFTDPPYTPDGVSLFLTRGLQGLRTADDARLVMAYGYGEQPALGLKVQQAVTGLGLAFEAILPGFNRYHGAQAIGGSSDLYVLHPTAGAARRSAKAKVNIYTHGSQSVEGEAEAPAGPGWPPTVDHQRVALADVLGGGEPPAALGRLGETVVAVDLRADPGFWLMRVLLGVTAARMAVLVPNNHPDLVDEQGQRALSDVVGAKYRLRYRRSTPGPRLAIVEAERTEVASAARDVLDRSHGKVANTWREALVRALAFTKNEARDRINATASRPPLLDERLISLPRHAIATLLAEVTTSAGA
jgi:hypothetical protein